MAAPVQVSNASLSGIGLYYVPPDGEPRNAAAEFLSNFTATRTPWTQAVFLKRLDALDPTKQQAQLQALVNEKVRLVEAQAAARNAANKAATDQQLSADDTLRTLFNYQASIHTADTSLAVARTNQETEDKKNRQVTSAQGKQALAFARSSVGAAVQAIAEGADPATTTTDLIRSLANAKEQVDGLGDGGERDAIQQELQGLQIPLSNPGAKAAIAGAVQTFFPPPSELTTHQFGAKTASVDDLLGQFQKLQGASPAATGGSGVATGGAPSSTSSPASRTSPPGDPSGAALGPAGDPLQSSIDMIDRLITRHQADYQDNPFGKLGGFKDRLYGLEKRGQGRQAMPAAASLVPGAEAPPVRKGEPPLPDDPLMRKPLSSDAIFDAATTRANLTTAPKPAASSSGKAKPKAEPVDPAQAQQTRSDQMAALAAMMQPRKPSDNALLQPIETPPSPMMKRLEPVGQAVSQDAGRIRDTVGPFLGKAYDLMGSAADRLTLKPEPPAAAPDPFEKEIQALLGPEVTLTPEDIRRLKARAAQSR